MSAQLKALARSLLDRITMRIHDLVNRAAELLSLQNVVGMNGIRRGIDFLNEYLDLTLPPLAPADAPEEVPQEEPEEEQDAPPAADAQEDLPDDPFAAFNLCLQSMNGLIHHVDHVQEILETDDDDTITETIGILEHALDLLAKI